MLCLTVFPFLFCILQVCPQETQNSRSARGQFEILMICDISGDSYLISMCLIIVSVKPELGQFWICISVGSLCLQAAAIHLIYLTQNPSIFGLCFYRKRKNKCKHLISDFNVFSVCCREHNRETHRCVIKV